MAPPRTAAIPSPKTGRELVELYFLENRTRVLELAAFLDRLDRAALAHAERGDPARDPDGDFRVRALRGALGVLAGGPADAAGAADPAARTERVQHLLSDPTGDLLPRADRKSARGAYEAAAYQAYDAGAA